MAALEEADGGGVGREAIAAGPAGAVRWPVGVARDR
jgi:hypothetical protein